MRDLLRVCMALMVVCFALEVQAQAKSDVLVFLNGERKEVKVTGVDDTHIKFRYPGEDFDNQVSKMELTQVEFASGRVEKFGAPSIGAGSTVAGDQSNHGSSPDRHNKIAVLPFSFISNDPGMSPQSMSTLVQSTTSNFVKSEYGTLTVQDPMTTNALLAKAGVTADNIAAHTPDELGALLGVEYVMYGTVNITNKGTSTYGVAGSSYKEKETKTSSDNKTDDRTKGSGVTSTSSTTTIEYDTSVDLRMFNDRGDNLYSSSRHVFGTAADAYKSGIEYMVKRTPFGSKYGKK